MKKTHLYTAEDKRNCLGDGPWCNEPDLVTFIHEGVNCVVCRIIKPECNALYVFGGYLCGYVQLPEGHPWVASEFEGSLADVHGGVTFKDEIKDFGSGEWIGFDCAHFGDIVPSMVFNATKSEALKQFNLAEKFPNSFLFNETYKDMEFCIAQTKCLAEQVNQANYSEVTK